MLPNKIIELAYCPCTRVSHILHFSFKHFVSNNLPNEVCDNKKLHSTVYNSKFSVSHHHYLRGLIVPEAQKIFLYYIFETHFNLSFSLAWRMNWLSCRWKWHGHYIISLSTQTRASRTQARTHEYAHISYNSMWFELKFKFYSLHYI